MLRRIAPSDVRLGMYIQSFDGPWLSHPFWRNSFIVTDQVDLLRVQASKIKAVVIDDAKGTGLEPVVRTSSMPTCVANDRVPDRILRSRAKTALRRTKGAGGERGAFTRNLLRDSKESPSAAAERAEIVRILAESALEVRQAFDGLTRGHALPMAALASVVEDLSAAMAYNRTLMVGVSRLKTKDEYTFAHSVAVAALMLGLARQLALDEQTVRDLALGGLVHDVGKMLIDDAILQKPGPLSNAEFAEMKRHPELGHRILSEDETISPIVLDVTLSHHERLDGRGYPNGLVGDELSLYTRIAGICDVFDALTSARVYKNAMPAHQAITMMASWEGQFDRDLLLAFMRSIGLYPPGMLVRLGSQRLGVVLPPPRRGGRIRVRAFHCAATDTPLSPCDVVISENGCGEMVVTEELPENWSIEDWPSQRECLLGANAKHAI